MTQNSRTDVRTDMGQDGAYVQDRLPVATKQDFQ